MYEEFVKLTSAVRKTEAHFRAHPEAWLWGGWWRSNGQRCVMGGIIEQYTEGKYVHGYSESVALHPTGAELTGYLTDQLTWLAFDMGVLIGSGNIVEFNDRQSSVTPILHLLAQLGDALEALTEWQAELDGLTPMQEIAVPERAQVLVGGQ